MSKAPTSRPITASIIAGITSQPYLLLIAAPTFWGGNVIASKFAVGHIDPYVLLLTRWAGAFILLLTIATPHVRRDWHKIKPALGWLCLYGALGFAIFNLLMYQAAYFTDGVNISIEHAAIPVLTLLANFIVFRTRAKWLQIVGLVLTIIGVVYVATHGEPAKILSLTINFGDGLVLLACFLYAIYSITLRFRPDMHWLSFITVTAAFAFVTSVLAGQFMGGGLAELATKLPETTLQGWLCGLYVMIFPSIIGQMAYARGVQLVGPNRASIFINLIPITGTVFSVILLGEILQPYHFIASVLVIAGIILSEFSVRQKASH